MTSISNSDSAPEKAEPAQLPLHAKEAVLFSAGFVTQYRREHWPVSGGLPPSALMQLATARLEWILRETRRELSGRFTSEEFWALLECYQGTVFFPDLFYSLASDLCDDCGVDLDAYETSSIAPLVSKLLALTPCQRATLADALEQAWYRGMQSCKSPETIFSSLGIKLL